MYLLYSMLLIAWGVVLVPVFLYKAWRYHKYLPGLAQRLGHLPDSLRFKGQETIWFHACSVGETLSLQPLVSFLHQRFPDARFVFSTVTKTGQQVALQCFAAYGEGSTFYFPIDFASVAKRVLNWIRPMMLVIIDTEIWPNLLHQTYCRGIPIVLVNGRVSARSFQHYRWARPVMGKVFRNYRILMMQSEEDAARITKIGAPQEKILVTGNIKFDKDLMKKESGDALTHSLQQDFGLDDSSVPLIVAGSTHQGEEQILLQVLQRIRQVPALQKTRLLLAPRHPERFGAVARLAVQSGFEICRRTDGGRSGRNAPVLLLDSLGELAAVYQFATIVFVGGTLVRHGGHSILEPAVHSKAIVIGPSMENFRQILDEFRSRNGVSQIRAGEGERNLQIQQLLDVFLKLLQNERERETLGAAALSILERNRGAVMRSGEKIAAIFEEAKMKDR